MDINLSPRRASLPSIARIAAAILTGIACAALVLQFVILIGGADGLGLTRATAIVRYFSYFTIQSNCLVMLVSVWATIDAPGFLASNRVRAAVATYIGMVGIVYFLILQHLWAPQGAQWLADTLLHDVTPLAYLAFWFAFVPKAGLRWRDPVLFLIYPVAYLAVVLVLGLGSGFFPYPFIDLTAMGPIRVILNAAILLAAFLVMGLVLVAFGRLRRSTP